MELRPYQKQAVDWTFEYLESMKGNPCICLPTGSGKSLVLADIIRRWPQNKSVLLLSHRSEILEQNERKIRALLPLERIGIYSASLKKKTIQRITIAQVQSFAKVINKLDFKFDLIIIDENHLVPHSGEGQYQKIIKAHPEARVIGLTATPIRLDSGSIVGPNKIFNHFSYEADIKGLVADGYLAPLVGKSSVHQANLSNVGVRGKEYIFSEAMKAINQASLTERAVEECLKYGADRKHWIVFCAGVEHAEKVSEVFSLKGISNRVVTGETIPLERNKYFNEFSKGEIKALINCEVLTTGFDMPCVDMIVMLRATLSTSLYVQILGRGMRPFQGKENCLVLDFCGNLEKHGPIDAISYNVLRTEKGEVQGAPGKICPNCRSLCHTAVKDCPECGFVFPERIVAHESVASELEPMGVKKPQQMAVEEVEFEIVKSKKSQKNMLRITYYSAYRAARVVEFLLFEHEGFAREKSESWYRRNTIIKKEFLPLPDSIDTAFHRIKYEMLFPKTIWVKQVNGFDTVVSRTLSNQTVRERERELEKKEIELEI